MRMGHRIRDRLTELKIGQVDLLTRIPDLGAGTLSALITRNSIASEWSDQIAEALNVNHRWLQTGNGPKEPYQQSWPFPNVSHTKVCVLKTEDLLRLEGALVGAAAHYGLDVGKGGTDAAEAA